MECQERRLIQGVPVYCYGKVASTMNVAEDILNKGKTGIITATEQSEGRGRYGRNWFSKPGGLYISWILESKEFSHLSELLALAIVKTMESLGIVCKIKMPNDIITDGRKIAGILIIKNGDFYIAGIGINVNNEVGDISARVSVKQILGREVKPTDVLEQFVKTFLISKKQFAEDERLSLQTWSQYLIK